MTGADLIGSEVQSCLNRRTGPSTTVQILPNFHITDLLLDEPANRKRALVSVGLGVQANRSVPPLLI